MLRHHSYAVLGLGLCVAGFHVSALAVEKPEWQAAMEALETRSVKAMLPTHQLLLGELEAESRKAEASGDAKASAEIKAAAAKARREHGWLKKGQVPQPRGPDSPSDGFAQAADGVHWALSNTRNLKRIGAVDGRLHQFSEDGRLDGGIICHAQMIPGLFQARRDERTWNCYLISQDLEQVLCVITPQTKIGTWISGKKPLPATSAVTSPTAEVVPAPEGQKVELRVLLERKCRQQRLEHEDKVIRLLESFLKEAAESDKGAIERRLAQAKATREVLSHAVALKAERVVETKEGFLARVEGAVWLAIGVMQGGNRLLFTKDAIQAVRITGQVQQSLPTEVLWPGALRFRVEDGSSMVAVFSPDLDRLMFVPVKAEFPGKRVR